MADALVAKHPVNTLNDVKNLDPHVWAQETFKIAQEFAYINIKENEPLSEAYIT